MYWKIDVRYAKGFAGGEKVTSVLILKCLPGLDFQQVESQQ